jgi:hypothetical protein
MPVAFDVRIVPVIVEYMINPIVELPLWSVEGGQNVTPIGSCSLLIRGGRCSYAPHGL